MTNSISSHNIRFVKSPSKIDPGSLAIIISNLKADNNACSVNRQFVDEGFVLLS